MKRIKLSRDAFAIIDDEDFEKVSQYKWHLLRTGYAARKATKLNPVTRMHRLITNASSELEVDHINGNRLDNRKQNLRICSRTENSRNTRIRSDNTSGYKGVSYIAASKMWRVKICIGGQQIHIGCFSSQVEAARQYDVAAVAAFGSFAKTNKGMGLIK